MKNRLRIPIDDDGWSSGCCLLITNTLRFTCCFRWYGASYTDWWLWHWLITACSTINIEIHTIIDIVTECAHFHFDFPKPNNFVLSASIDSNKIFVWSKFSCVLVYPTLDGMWVNFAKKSVAQNTVLWYLCSLQQIRIGRQNHQTTNTTKTKNL